MPNSVKSDDSGAPDVAIPTKIDYERTWFNFYGGALTYKFDVWADELPPDLLQELTALFTVTLSEEVIRNQLEAMHYHALHSDLSDQWLSQTLLGQRLRESNLRILAFIERPCAFDFLALVPTLKCSLLIGRSRNPN